MTSSRRSSRIAGKSLPNTPSASSEVPETVTPAAEPVKKAPSTQKGKKATSQNNNSNNRAKSSGKFLSKFANNILEEAIRQDNSVSQTPSRGNASTVSASSRAKWTRKIQKHLLQKISEASKTSFLTEEYDAVSLKAKIDEKQQKIEVKIKQLSQVIAAQISRSKLSTLPRLPDVGYESGQFEEKVGMIGEKINKISVELSNATKQLEERVVSFDQTYSIIKGNVDHLILQQQQQQQHLAASNSGDGSSFGQEGTKAKDPLQKLHDHLSEK